MFKSITYNYTSEDRCYYTLEDDDFTVTITGADIPLYVTLCLGPEIAEEYEKRKLNAAANLALYYKELMGTRKFTLDEIIRNHQQNVFDFNRDYLSKYLDDIKKYLLLM